MRRARDDRVDLRAVGRGDVEAVVEREAARTLDAVLRERVREDSARVAEESADRVLPVERPHRPAVRLERGRARDVGEGEDRDQCREPTHGGTPG